MQHAGAAAAASAPCTHPPVRQPALAPASSSRRAASAWPPASASPSAERPRLLGTSRQALAASSSCTPGSQPRLRMRTHVDRTRALLLQVMCQHSHNSPAAACRPHSLLRLSRRRRGTAKHAPGGQVQGCVVSCISGIQPGRPRHQEPQRLGAAAQRRVVQRHASGRVFCLQVCPLGCQVLQHVQVPLGGRIVHGAAALLVAHARVGAARQQLHRLRHGWCAVSGS